MTHRTSVLVVSGGDPPLPAALSDLPDDAYVIAADSGLDHALGAGLRVDLVVGDLDSVSPEGLAAARAGGVAIERHPPEKDATDLELALDRAMALGADDIVVVGGAGGRFDHVVGGLLLLTSARYAAADVTARLGDALVTVVRKEAALQGRVGSYVSLLPADGPAIGISTTGLLYPLHDEDLKPGASRGVSNEFVTPSATVAVRVGVLLAIQPGAL